MAELRASGQIYYNEGDDVAHVVLADQPIVASGSRSLHSNAEAEDTNVQEVGVANDCSPLITGDNEEDPVQEASGQGLDSPPISQENQERTSLLGVLKDQVVDDATLDVQSSFLRANRVFKLGRKQLVIERKSNEEGTDEFLAKEINTGSAGLYLLRGIYTAVAFLMSGFMFNFCVQVFLYLFLGLVTELGGVGREVDDAFTFLPFMGILLSIPVFLIAFANMMTLAMVFVQNTWNGHHFTKTALKWKSVIVDWVALLVFVVVPILVGTISLSLNVDDWWNQTLLAWMICVFCYFLVFSMFAIYHEVNGCYQLIRGEMKKEGPPPSFGRICLEAIKIKMHYTLDIVETVDYFSSEIDEAPKKISLKKLEELREKSYSHYSPWRLFTILLRKCCLLNKCCYTNLEDKVLRIEDNLLKNYSFEEVENQMQKQTPFVKYESIEEVQNQTPYITRNTWSLEEIFCRDRTKRHIIVLNAEDKGSDYSLTKAQRTSSFVCYLLGVVFFILVLVAFMLWFGLFQKMTLQTKDKGVAGLVTALFLVCLYWIAMVFYDPVRKYFYVQKMKDEQTKDEILYEVVDHYKTAEAKDPFCWVCFFFQIILFFVLPTGALFYNENYPLGAFFVCVSLVTGMRWYINSTNCIQKYGTYKSMEMDNKYRGERSQDAKDEKWREEHRLGLINREISSGRKNFFWQCVFLFFTFAFCAICVFAIDTGEAEANTQKNSDSYNFVENWEYTDSGTMEYPSCSIGENFYPPSKTETSLVDFAFLSNMAYRSDQNAKKDMKEWFGNETKIEYFTNTSEIIKEFENSYKRPSNVVYKLFGFPNEEEPQKSVAILSVKGTDNAWDILADAQIWVGAAISQFVRSLIPLGSLFTPLLEDLIWFVSLIESKQLRDLSFYQKITALVDHLDNSTSFKQDYPNLILTGHSLGGGLAMISGAQTKKPVISLSGPNTLLSRRTFDPVITPEALKNYTFNIVPDRDPVPRVDDLSENFQRIQCRTSANNFIGCHYIDQSICELLLSCGSEGRPIPCDCIERGRDKSNPHGEIFFEKLSRVEGTTDDKNDICPKSTA